MSLAAALAAGPPRTSRKGPPCSIGLLLAALPADESAALGHMLGDTHPQTGRRLWSGSEVARRLTAEIGHKTTTQTVSRHRRQECSCVVV